VIRLGLRHPTKKQRNRFDKTKQHTHRCSIASDVVKAQGEHPAISSCVREDRVKMYVGGSQPLGSLVKKSQDRTDPQYELNKTKQHTHEDPAIKPASG